MYILFIYRVAQAVVLNVRPHAPVECVQPKAGCTHACQLDSAPEARTGLGYWDARNRLLQRERPLVRGPKVVSRGVGVGFGDQPGAPM